MGRTGRLLLALLLGCAPSREAAEPGPAYADGIRPERLRRHVEALASDRMQGRLTGSEGERRAADYLARAFEQIGLEPAGDAGGWFHEFPFLAGASLGAHNDLALAPAPTPGNGRSAVDRDWRPLAFSRTGSGGPAPVVFAGYGIVAPPEGDEPGYDAYAGLDVRGRFALVLRDRPEAVAPARRQRLNRYASLRHKAMLARERGALGLLVAGGPHARRRGTLVPLRRDASGGASGLLAASLTDALADRLLAPSGRSLAALQAELDAGAPRPGFEVPGLRLALRIDLVQERRVGRNALARLPGASPRAAPVLVGAHYDHLGRAQGIEGSLAQPGERGRIHPGADDNASGVAALLEIARALALDAQRGAPLHRDLLFAAWSGEELGLLGSGAWARRLPGVHEVARGAPRPLSAYLNLDMVGRLRGPLVLQGVGSSPLWPELVARARRAGGGDTPPLTLQAESYLPTDATSFYLRGIPSLSAFTGAHDAYHTPRDRPETLDYPGLARVARLVAELARSLARREALPAFATAARGAGPHSLEAAPESQE